MELTTVSFQDLHDLPSLQIPQPDFIIFAPAHDPFSPCHREARSDAVLRIRVASVSLQTSRGIVVPQTDRGVMCG